MAADVGSSDHESVAFRPCERRAADPAECAAPAEGRARGAGAAGEPPARNAPVAPRADPARLGLGADRWRARHLGAWRPAWRRHTPQELYSTDRKPIADGLRTLPGDYGSLPKPALPAGVPPLGPPLPGDLGRPFLRAQQEQGAPVVTPTAPAGPTAEEQAAAAERERLRQEAEAARRGALFVQVRQKSADQPAAEAAVAGPATPPNPFAALPGSAESARPDEAAGQNGQDKKSAFLNAATDAKIYASGRL